MKNKKGFASLVLIGALVVLIAVGGYFLWHKKVQAPTQISTPVSDTVGWHTYTNSKYGFELKYPQDLSNLTVSKFDTKTLLDVGKNDINGGFKFYLTLTVEDTAEDNIQACNADDFTHNLLQKNENKTRTEIKLSDESLIAWKVQEKIVMPGGNDSVVFLSKKDCGNIFAIVSGSGPLSVFDQNLFNTILSTLKSTK